MKKNMSFLLIILCFYAFQIKAEGTKDISPTILSSTILTTSGDWGGEFARYDGMSKNRLYVHIKDFTKEKIYIGLNAQTGNAFVRVKAPDGTILAEGAKGISNTVGSKGRIDNYTQSTIGPDRFNAGGYNAHVFKPTMNGDYYIEINEASPTFKAPTAIPGTPYRYNFFDVTVGDTSDVLDPIKEGRVWAYKWSLSTGSTVNPYNAVMYVLREDSIRFEVDYNGIQPFGFGIVSNSFGITNTNNFLEDRKSIDSAYQQGSVYFPTEHKIFLNEPDVEVYPFPTKEPELSLNTSSSGLITGCVTDGLCINISANKGGQAEVKLDLDGVPGYQPGGRDRIVYGNINPGINCVYWDGLDGLNDTALAANIEVNYKFEAGLIHIPIFDAENHSNGYVFKLLEPGNQKTTMDLYWDDSNFFTSTPYPPYGQNLTGCASPCRNWPLNYGNERFMNTWSFAYNKTLTISNVRFEFCPPELFNDTVQTPEQVSVLINPLANDKKPFNQFDLSTFQVVINPVNGNIIKHANGTVTYTPDVGFVGIDSMAYYICDTATSPVCDTAYIYVDVLDINLPPIIDTVNGLPVIDGVSSEIIVNEDDSVEICIQWKELEGNGIVASSLLGTPSNGTVSGFDGDSCFVYTPNPDYSGPDTLLVLICDDEVPPSCDTLVIPIQAIAINDSPVIISSGGINEINDTIKVIDILEDTPTDLCFFTTDADVEDTLVLTQLLLAPSHGVVSGVNSGDTCMNYTPNPNYVGYDTLQVSICDNGTPVLCDYTTVIINVLPVNDPPVAINDTIYMDPATVAVKNIGLNDFDVETPHANLVYNVTAAPYKALSWSISNDEITYSPNFIVGIDSIVYEVCDDATPSLCSRAVLYIAVPASQVAPMAFRDSISTLEDTPIDINILNNDFDPNFDAISPSLVGAPNSGPYNGTVLLANSKITYTPNPNFNGVDSVQYFICDNGSPIMCDTAWAVVSVIPVADNPILVDANGNPLDSIGRYYTINEDTPITICLNVNDPDGDGVDVTGGSSSLNLGEVSGFSDGDTCFTYMPKLNLSGLDSVVISICDDNVPASCSQEVWYINILPVNDTLVLNDDFGTTDENISILLNPLANDNDLADNGELDTASIKLIAGPYNGVANVNTTTGLVSYTPNQYFSGRDSIKYTLCDKGVPLPALCEEAYIYIDVNPINDAPIAVNDTVNTFVNIGVAISVLDNDNDFDGDSLTVSIINNTFNGTISIIGDSLVYVPNNDFCGVDSLQYQVCDNATPNLCDSAWVYISVNPNDADGDGLPDHIETLTADTDGDGVPDYLDVDSDNDGLSDSYEVKILGGDVCNPIAFDFDFDGVPDFRDPDSDNDGIPDWVERALVPTKPTGVDSDGDGIDDAFDADRGGVLITGDAYNRDADIGNNPDQWPDFRDTDSDGDGIPDYIEASVNWVFPKGVDSDGDGIDDAFDTDNGGSGLYDNVVDTDNNGMPDFRDLDSDGDGIADEDEFGDGPEPRDTDEDGVPDFRDLDSDDDGIGDGSEGQGDCDDDGIPDYLDEDTCAGDMPSGFSPNGDGVNDTYVISILDGADLANGIYKNNSFIIYNRWGIKVYEKKPYDNSWDGSANVKGVLGGDDTYLPTGTYYYLFDTGIPDYPKQTGWIYLKK